MYYKNYVNISRRLDLEHSQVESMWFELKTKLSPILININYRSERESHINYWQLFESIITKALDENSRIICLGDLIKISCCNPRLSFSLDVFPLIVMAMLKG